VAPNQRITITAATPGVSGGVQLVELRHEPIRLGLICGAEPVPNLPARLAPRVVETGMAEGDRPAGGLPVFDFEAV
jgi:hypothetical protein